MANTELPVKRLLALLLALASVVLSPEAQAQQMRRAGLPYFSEHYAPERYGAHPQNSWVVQDHRGIIYVANSSGVLEFDGATWRTIYTPSTVLSLAVDEDGTVYVGLTDDLGYLRPGTRGDLQFVSLSDRLPHSYRGIGSIWTTHATPDGVYFQSREYILRWDGAKFKAWNARGLFHLAFAVNKRYFVREQRVGLQELVDDSLRLVPGGEAFADDQIWFMTANGEEIILGSRQSGLYAWRGDSLRSVPTEADAYLTQHQLHHGATLPGGHIALATVTGGVAIITNGGVLVDVLDPSRGLPDTRVNYVFTDAQGGLWMAFNSQGVMRADVISPVTLFNDQLGLQGVVLNMSRRGQSLFAATGAGLFEINLQRRTAKRVAESDPAVASRLAEVWESANYGDDLLLASTKGLLRLDAQNVVHEINQARTYAVLVSNHIPGAIYAGTASGIELLRRSGDSWVKDIRLPLVGEAVRDIVEEPSGTVWFMGGESDLYRIDAADSGPVEIRTFSTKDGLPAGRFGVTLVGDALAVIHPSGVYRYRGAGFQPAFARDQSFDAPWASRDDHLYALTEDNQGNVWVVYGDRTEILTPTPDGYRFSSPDALRLGSAGIHGADVFIEDSGVAWIAYGDNILRYDPSQARHYDYHYRTLIRRVSPLGETWNVFGGAFATSDGVVSGQQSVAPPKLVYQFNDLRFEFAAPSYNDPHRNLYQYQLENHDEGWSAWSTMPVAEFTNLSEGSYRLRVRSRNAQGYVSSEGIYAFTILPPWYRTWWAYFMYVVLGATFVALSIQYRRMRLDNLQAQQQARELALERVVNERLTQVNDRLRQADLLKDQLLSNTSHELRTPITAILGFTSVLKDEAPQNMQEFLDIIEENGHRLMRTVTSMVDFARLQAGVIELNREPVEVSREVEQVVSRLAHLARKKQLYFEFAQPEDHVHAWLDKKCLERITENLLTNAIKFTEEGGVTVRVNVDDDSVYIRVEDTGIGMDSDFMPELFKAFKQESSGLTRSHEGSGLGLAITARLVELMEGEIDVKTSKSEGTVVTVSFPVFYVAEPERRQSGRPISRRSSA